MSEELKPCPFCGSTNLDMRDARDFITCRDCGTEGPFTPGLGSTGSIEAWNRRANEQQRQDCEPDAWMDADGDLYATEPDKNWCPPHTPLYAAPPKREPLSDEQIEALNFVSADRLDYDTYEIDKASVFDFARAIERAHGIGGQS